MSGPIQERNQGELNYLHLHEARNTPKKSILLLSTDATVYVGGLDEKVTEALLWELFLQAGPIGAVLYPLD